MDVERLLPLEALRPRWSSASSLVYIGGFVALTATTALISILGNDHGDWAFVGYSVLATGLALLLALLLDGSGRDIAAGVIATLTVVFFAIFVGSVENALGILDFQVDDWQPASLVVEALTFGAAFLALQRFRAPLLMLPIALIFWIVVADLGSIGSWSNAGEVLSILVGLALIAAAVSIDGAGREAYGFWPHLVGGFALGGGVLGLVGSDVAWALVGLLSLAYVAASYLLGRSSYAVLGAIGILTTTTYFTFDAVGLVGTFLPFGAGPVEGEASEPWQVALWFVVVGLGIVGLGLIEDRITGLRRAPATRDV